MGKEAGKYDFGFDNLPVKGSRFMPQRTGKSPAIDENAGFGSPLKDGPRETAKTPTTPSAAMRKPSEPGIRYQIKEYPCYGIRFSAALLI